MMETEEHMMETEEYMMPDLNGINNTQHDFNIWSVINSIEKTTIDRENTTN